MGEQDSYSDLTYAIPPDILRYDKRYIFGIASTELVIAAGLALPVIYLIGPFVGLIAGVVALLILHRIESLGNRSIVVYLIQRAVHNARERRVNIARLMPETEHRLEIFSWDMQKIVEYNKGDSGQLFG